MEISKELQERVFAAGMHRDEPAFAEAVKACPNCWPFEGGHCFEHAQQLAQMYPNTPQCPPDCCSGGGGSE